MERRVLLKLMAASAALASCGPDSAGDRGVRKRRVGVVGAGIVGASIAYHLAKAGAQVVLMDRHAPATRASRGTFAWINATWAKQPRSYHQINQRGVSGWQNLQIELGIPIRWGGSLEWFGSAARQEKLAAQIEEQIAWGEPAQMLAPDAFAQLEPKVNLLGAQAVAFSPNDGAVDPVLATNMLVEGARALGATVMTQCAVTSADYGRESVTLETSKGTVEVDQIVLATGADLDAMAAIAGADIPQRATPGVIAVTAPLPPLLSHVVATPGIHMHQRLDGRIVLGEQAGAPDTQAHAARLGPMPYDFPTPQLGQEHAGRIVDIARDFLPDIADAQIEDAWIGWRPLPLDGHPVLGPSPAHPQAYVAVMHSGVTLAPIVGALAAQEILGREISPALDAYRPTREFMAVKRY